MVTPNCDEQSQAVRGLGLEKAEEETLGDKQRSGDVALKVLNYTMQVKLSTHKKTQTRKFAYFSHTRLYDNFVFSFAFSRLSQDASFFSSVCSLLAIARRTTVKRPSRKGRSVGDKKRIA